MGSCLLVEESCLLGTYYFVYLNVLQEMKTERFLHQGSLRFFVLFPKENKILFELGLGPIIYLLLRWTFEHIFKNINNILS